MEKKMGRPPKKVFYRSVQKPMLTAEEEEELLNNMAEAGFYLKDKVVSRYIFANYK